MSLLRDFGLIVITSDVSDANGQNGLMDGFGENIELGVISKTVKVDNMTVYYATKGERGHDIGLHMFPCSRGPTEKIQLMLKKCLFVRYDPNMERAAVEMLREDPRSYMMLEDQHLCWGSGG